MSRAHAIAPAISAKASYRGSAHTASVATHRGVSRPERQVSSCYVERALLLWPRLDRARISRISDNPARIAELVSRRTSQPYDVILAMLTRQTDRLVAPTEPTAGFDSGRAEAARVTLRVVRSEAGTQIEIQDLLPA